MAPEDAAEPSEASEDVEPSMDPLADPGDCPLENGVEGREIWLVCWRLLEVRTISMNSWICIARLRRRGDVEKVTLSCLYVGAF